MSYGLVVLCTCFVYFNIDTLYLISLLKNLIKLTCEIDKTLNTNVAKAVRSKAEAHHQRAEVIRRSSPPHAVSVPFTPRGSNGIGRGGT